MHTKIPVLSNLVEGPHVRRSVQAACAQALIDACAGLIAAKPPHRAGWRVTCAICLPDADHVIDLGPEGGAGGGLVVAEGAPGQVARAAASRTGRALGSRLAH